MFYAIDTMQNIAAILVSISIFINSILISLSLRFLAYSFLICLLLSELVIVIIFETIFKYWHVASYQTLWKTS